MSKRQRLSHSTEQGVVILRHHRVEEFPVSDLCNEYEPQPSVFYRWLKQARENRGAAVVPKSNGADRHEKQLAAENQQLKTKLAQKDGIIAEPAHRASTACAPAPITLDPYTARQREAQSTPRKHIRTLH